MIVTVFFEAKKNRLALQKREELLPIERKIGYVHRIFYQKEFAEDIKTTRLPNLLKNMYACNGNSKINTIKKYAPKILFWLYAQNFIGILYNAIIMGYISYCILVTKSIVGIGKFSSLITANSQLVNSLYSFFAFLSQADNLGLYAKRIEEFMNSPSHIESQNISEIKKAVLKGAIKVEFNNVCFSYDNSQFSLKNINLKVFPGETVAIVGANGAGKTTISKLLLRLYDIDSGEISLNDKSISSYDIKTLRNNIGVVYQRNNIYALSFSDNVQLHNEYSIPEMEKTIDELRLNDVLKKSNADVTSQMTREFDECGILLSGGELQKMGIARVINSSAGLLILDEPSSALDPIAEYELTGILKSKSKYTTTIIISHRLSTVKHADRIYVMANGEIVEQGTHTELMANSKMYSEMFKKQSEFYK